MPQRVKVSMFLWRESLNLFGLFCFGVWGREEDVRGEGGSDVDLVQGDLIFHVCSWSKHKNNSHVRQTLNNPQTNANTSACGAGTYSSVEGATTLSTCTTCGAGTYSGTEGATAESTCNKCQAGTYSEVEGATVATTCQGKFVSFREPKPVWFRYFIEVWCRSGVGGSVLFGFLSCENTHTHVKLQIINK